MKILICEDDPGIQELLELVISDMGLTSVKCQKLDQVIPVLQQGDIDLLIVDYWFKTENAGKLIKEIKDSPDLSDVPIILISAVPNLPQLAEQLGTDAHIAKPFNITHVQELIHQFNPYAQETSHN